MHGKNAMFCKAHAAAAMDRDLEMQGIRKERRERKRNRWLTRMQTQTRVSRANRLQTSDREEKAQEEGACSSGICLTQEEQIAHF